jgi:dihydroorotate dehydrogenase electron transfer subunit
MNSARASIHLEEGTILEHRAFAGNQHIIRVAAPAAAALATPGSFAHVTCDPAVPLRRPLSIMRADAAAGWLEFLYKPIGAGLAKLTRRKIGEHLSILAPIGHGFALDTARPRVLAIGGGVGIPPMVFLAQELRQSTHFELVVLMGSELPFPFTLVGSTLDVGVAPPGATHGLELLEQWHVPSRLASNAGISGAYAGYVTELARLVLAARSREALRATQIVACGPESMLRAAAKLAASHGLPCQVALEEFMACGVGGCAGCTVLVRTPHGEAMKRVCVDGPVFDAATVCGLMDRG